MLTNCKSSILIACVLVSFEEKSKHFFFLFNGRREQVLNAGWLWSKFGHTKQVVLPLVHLSSAKVGLLKGLYATRTSQINQKSSYPAKYPGMAGPILRYKKSRTSQINQKSSYPTKYQEWPGQSYRNEFKLYYEIVGIGSGVVLQNHIHIRI